MSDYKKLKEVLKKERKDLYNRIRNGENIVDKYKKIAKTVAKITDGNEFTEDYDSLLRLKKYFPSLEDEFNTLKKIDNYGIEIGRGNKDVVNDIFIKDLRECSKKYGIPPHYVVEETEKTVKTLMEIKKGNIDKVRKEELDMLLGNGKKNSGSLLMVVSGICYLLFVDLLKKISEQMKKEKDEKEDDLSFSKDEVKERIDLINKYNQKFTDDSLQEKFTSDELDEFFKLITSLLDKDTCEEILNNIKKDQEKFDKKEEVVNFDTLNMSLFNDEEKSIIEQLRDIYEDEEIDSNIQPLSNIGINFNDRLNAYNTLSMNEILQDVNTLLENIYDNKEEIINIFKLILDLYRKDNIRKIREERIIELQRISSDFNTIIDFINKTYKQDAFKESLLIKKEIMAINNEYIPVLYELINNNYYDDEDLDNELGNIILGYKKTIKKWKKEMTSYYQESDTEVDIKQNTNNLVFCLTKDIELEKEGYQKEFIGTIGILENNSSQELKKRTGRKGMSRIRKSTDTDDSKDFIKFLGAKYNKKFNFVPYRYSSDADYRTGLIKFSPSKKIKEYLEERYGLSKQSVFYGIFQVISVIGADHNEYSILESYIMDNLQYIDNISKMLSNEKPNLEEISSVLDGLLGIKEELIQKASNTSKKI